jgi:hypothetical protein
VFRVFRPIAALFQEVVGFAVVIMGAKQIGQLSCFDNPDLLWLLSGGWFSLILDHHPIVEATDSSPRSLSGESQATSS